MKIKVAEYIEQYLVSHGFKDVFTVVGGGAMHLNDALGHSESLHCTYNHHEQACAIAAEAYARINNQPAVVCVTSGPGATNAITGVVGAWEDSIPILVLSGQTKSSLTISSSGLNLRCLGNQEVDIVRMIESVTKFSYMITDANKIKQVLDKALYYMLDGRPGPVWIDIPLDIQGAYVDTDELIGFEYHSDNISATQNLQSKIKEVLHLLKKAKRPVLYAGNGIRIANAYQDFIKLTRNLNIPVVTCWNSIDLIENSNPLYCGRAGTMGDRAGNFAVQNADFLLIIGSRMNMYQVGYNVSTWAREAYTVVVDIDQEELKKNTVRIDMPICADAKHFISNMNILSCNMMLKNEKWVAKCNYWKNKYPVVLERHYKDNGKANIYAFIDQLSHQLKENNVIVVSNGSASVVGSQGFYIKKNQRFIMNCELSSMGYELPAAIGVSKATNESIICIAGDGSIQMNIQELQTIITNKLNIKIFVINNDGYHQIRLTQKNIFKNKLVGVGKESGDLDFPSFKKIASAYGYKYMCIKNNQMQNIIEAVLNSNEPTICEVFVTTDQVFEPKSATKKLDDGTLFSPPLEDLAPFLSREELKENMLIDVISEDCNEKH